MTQKSSILLILGTFLLVLFEVAWGPLFPSPWREFRPVLNLITLCLILNSVRSSFLVCLIAGIFLPLFSPDNTFALLRFSIVTGVLFLLSQSILTNRSIYSAIAAMMCARILDHLLALIVFFVGRILFGWEGIVPPWSSVLITVCWDVGVMSALFLMIALFTKRFISSPFRSSLYGS